MWHHCSASAAHTTAQYTTQHTNYAAESVALLILHVHVVLVLQVWVSQSLLPPTPPAVLEPLSHHLLDKHTLLQLSVQEAEFVLRTLITLFGTVRRGGCCDDDANLMWI